MWLTQGAGDDEVHQALLCTRRDWVLGGEYENAELVIADADEVDVDIYRDVVAVSGPGFP